VKLVNVLSQVKHEVMFHVSCDVDTMLHNAVLKGILRPLREKVWDEVLGHHRSDTLLSDRDEVRRRVVRRLLGLDV
jgi:hypothetical protein